MTLSPLAGKPAPRDILVNVPRLITAYYKEVPDPSVASQRVAFGTSGHRGSAFDAAFNEWHILAITQGICEYRKKQGTDGPLFLGMDTHALSVPALASALEVLAANGVDVMLAEKDEYTPTPTISHAILTYNRERKSGLADGIVITPSHNPPESGGFKYNPTNGGPADTTVTGWIEARANELMEQGLRDVKRIPYEKALRSATTHRHDYLNTYVADLGNVIDMEAIRGSKVRLGVDPLGGAGVHYWAPDRGALRFESHGRERCGRPDFQLHDRRLGRPHSHGSFLAVCHAAAHRAQGPFRYRFRVRHGSRPAWRRSAEHRPAAPESLSRGVRVLPVPESPQVGQEHRGRQDRRQQPDDRSRHHQTRSQAVRGAGRVQMVRRWPHRRLAGLCRRGECGRYLPAH